MAATAGNIKGLFSFFQLCGNLKHLKRTGWVNNDVKEPETVAGHMYRMAMMCMLFGAQDVARPLDREKCIRMALVHDLAESLVGDITPLDGVTKEEKYRRELEGMEHIRTLVSERVRRLVENSSTCGKWVEYEEGKSSEAILVKDLDMFDMIFQAFEYEKTQQEPNKLQQFFNSTKGKFRHAEVKMWVDQLLQVREQDSTKK